MANSKALVAGWFSLTGGHATIGDGLSLQNVCNALTSAGIPFDVSSSCNLSSHEHRVKIWISGPVDRSYQPQQALIGDGTGWVLASTTLITDRLDPGGADITAARDGHGVATRADFAFLSPVASDGAYAGVLLRGLQPEYRTEQSHHDAIRGAVHDAVVRSGMYPVELSTRIPGAASPAMLSAGLERLIATSTVTITSRLHGIMHCLRAGRMPVVIDEVPNGGKVTAFARQFGLPVLLAAEQCTTPRLLSAIEEACGIEESMTRAILEKATASAHANLDLMVSIVAAHLVKAT